MAESNLVLIIIDGLDASGKSTQAELLADYLRKKGKTYILRSHPSEDNFFGIRAREYLFLEGKSAHIAASLFYLADVIRSILLYNWRRVDYLIYVRYLLGTAYLPAPAHKIAYLFFSKIVPTSNNMFYLKISPEEAFRRVVKNRAKRERFETIEELNMTSEKALELVSNGPWKIINGNLPITEIHEKILKATQ
jgi:dTMP kinase